MPAGEVNMKNPVRKVGSVAALAAVVLGALKLKRSRRQDEKK